MDQTISGTFYISFASILGGLLASTLMSPITKVERNDKVLFGYIFTVEYDLLSNSENKSSILPAQTRYQCRAASDVRRMPTGLRKNYMIAALSFFSLSQLLCLFILMTSIARIFFDESIRIRIALRLMFLSTVISVLLWFAMTTVLAAKKMPYLAEMGFYDVSPEAHKTIAVGFYLSLISLVVCVVSILVAPFATAH